MQTAPAVVSNTSPIINLAAIGQLDLLRELYGILVIPDAVYDEIVVRGHEQPGAGEVQRLSWFVRRSVSNQTLVAQLIGSGLDIGEAEAIVLALETNASLLLMDEKLGRAAAAGVGVQVISLLGVLIEAKSRGHVAAIRPLLDALRSGPGFYIASALYARFSNRQESSGSPSRSRVCLNLEHAHEVLEVQIALHLVPVGVGHRASPIGIEQSVDPVIGLRRKLNAGDLAVMRHQWSAPAQ